ncbi:MAG: helical backbone metal receptor [Armatimonadetes bacterium]|nr:helical backbone metal receptor [Armatimonadota bacterium]
MGRSIAPHMVCRAAVLGAMLFAAVGSAAAPLTAVDARGKRVTLAAPPRRIVSLIPANTEIAFALGLGKCVVGVTTYCDYPPEARSVTKIGDLNTSIEKVLALRPDLILASDSGNRSALERLERLAQRARAPIFAVDPQNIDGLLRDIRSIGALTGATPAADGVVKRMETTLAAARKTATGPGNQPVRALFVVQQTPLWVVGSRNFMDDLMQRAGLQNVAAPLGKGFCSMPLERAIALRPDVLFTSQIPLKDLKDRPGWAQMQAVRTGRVFPMGYDAVRPGPRVADAILTMARLSRRAP